MNQRFVWNWVNRVFIEIHRRALLLVFYSPEPTMLQFMLSNRHNKKEYGRNSLSSSSKQSPVKAVMFLCTIKEQLLKKATCTEIWPRTEDSFGYLQDPQ